MPTRKRRVNEAAIENGEQHPKAGYRSVKIGPAVEKRLSPIGSLEREMEEWLLRKKPRRGQSATEYLNAVIERLRYSPLEAARAARRAERPFEFCYWGPIARICKPESAMGRIESKLREMPSAPIDWLVDGISTKDPRNALRMLQRKWRKYWPPFPFTLVVYRDQELYCRPDRAVVELDPDYVHHAKLLPLHRKITALIEADTKPDESTTDPSAEIEAIQNEIAAIVLGEHANAISAANSRRAGQVALQAKKRK